MAASRFPKQSEVRPWGERIDAEERRAGQPDPLIHRDRRGTPENRNSALSRERLSYHNEHYAGAMAAARAAVVARYPQRAARPGTAGYLLGAAVAPEDFLRQPTPPTVTLATRGGRGSAQQREERTTTTTTTMAGRMKPSDVRWKHHAHRTRPTVSGGNDDDDGTSPTAAATATSPLAAAATATSNAQYGAALVGLQQRPGLSLEGRLREQAQLHEELVGRAELRQPPSKRADDDDNSNADAVPNDSHRVRLQQQQQPATMLRRVYLQRPGSSKASSDARRRSSSAGRGGNGSSAATNTSRRSSTLLLAGGGDEDEVALLEQRVAMLERHLASEREGRAEVRERLETLQRLLVRQHEMKLKDEEAARERENKNNKRTEAGVRPSSASNTKAVAKPQLPPRPAPAAPRPPLPAPPTTTGPSPKKRAAAIATPSSLRGFNEGRTKPVPAPLSVPALQMKAPRVVEVKDRHPRVGAVDSSATFGKLAW